MSVHDRPQPRLVPGGPTGRDLSPLPVEPPDPTSEPIILPRYASPFPSGLRMIEIVTERGQLEERQTGTSDGPSHLMRGLQRRYERAQSVL